MYRHARAALDIVFNQLLNGLCDAKRVGEAMDVLLRRMPEFGCTPTVVSYNTLLKRVCAMKVELRRHLSCST
jgi:leucine-rich PPR motif-containing protein